MPRPTVYSVPLHEVFIEKLGKLNGFVRPACDACGINRSTMLRWLNRGRLGEEPFAQLLADVLSVQASKGELRMATVEAHALADPGTARWLAERTLPAELGLRDKVEAAAAEQLQAWLDAIMSHLDEATRERVLRAVGIVTGHAPAMDDDAEGGAEEVIDVEGESVGVGTRRLTDGS